MIAARQQPWFLWNARRSAVSHAFASPEKTRVTCATAPSYRAACFTMWRGKKPTRQRSMPSLIQTAAIAVSSFPSTNICTLRRRTTTSSANTSPQLMWCSSQERPWSPRSVPTISTTTPEGCVGGEGSWGGEKDAMVRVVLCCVSALGIFFELTHTSGPKPA